MGIKQMISLKKGEEHTANKEFDELGNDQDEVEEQDWDQADDQLVQGDEQKGGMWQAYLEDD